MKKEVPFKLNEQLEVIIEKQDHNGNGLVRMNHFPIFVKKALPTEKCLIEITKVKKNFAEGKIIEIIEESKNRVKPSSIYEELYQNHQNGLLMHQSYDEELKFKSSKITEILERFAKLEGINQNDILSSGKELNYRNKVTLHIKDKKIGYFNDKGDILDMHKDFLAGPLINKALFAIKENMLYLKPEQIVLREGLETNQLMITFITSKDLKEKKIIDSLSDIKELKSIIIKKDDKYHTIHGQNHILEKIGDVTYYVSPDSFFQVNTSGAKVLFDEIARQADVKDDETVIDLYCGAGSITLYLAKKVKEIIGVEINKDAISDAKKNAKINHINNVSFIKGDTKDIALELIEEGIKPDTIIVDPPRKGLDISVINSLVKLDPKKIIYVSCDPMSLARDIHELKGKYEVSELTPVDMFPNTKHVETVVKLTKVK